MRRGFRYDLDLAWVLTQKELRARYKNSFLGDLWSVANPLAFAAVFTLAFRIILGVPVRNYPLFVISGLFAWQWFLNSLSACSVVFLRNASLMKRVPFPTHFLPLAVVIHDMLHFLMALPVIFAFLLYYHRPLSPALLVGIPLLTALQAAVIYGLCLGISTVTLFLRDMERLVLIGLLLLFYLTPVIYSETMVPPRFVPMLFMNPAAPLVIAWRNLLLEGVLQPQMLAASTVHAVLFLAGGAALYRRISWKFAELV